MLFAESLKVRTHSSESSASEILENFRPLAAIRNVLCRLTFDPGQDGFVGFFIIVRHLRTKLRRELLTFLSDQLQPIRPDKICALGEAVS
jgi:hypothetical protein